MDYLRFNYNTIPQCDSAVVLCAGPSIISTAEKTKAYIKNNKSVVLSANYDYEHIGIKSDYTYITDTMKLFELLEDIKNPLIVPVSPKADRKFRKQIEEKMRPYKNNIETMIEKKIKPGTKI